MGIAKDIQQQKFRSEHQKLFINIAFTNSFLNGKLNTYLKPYGLSMQQFNVLRILRGQHPEPVSINSITERMIDKMSNASRLVDKLQLKEMVERRQCEADRRQVDVVLSERGIQVLSELDSIIPEFEHQFMTLTEDEARMVNDLLDKLRETKDN